MNAYEQRCMDQIARWRAQPPGWGTRLLAKPGGAAARAVQNLVPVSALRAALETVNRTALKLTRDDALLRRAGVAAPADLRQLPLETCDRLALSEARRAMAMAGAGGAVLGIAGAAGLVMDVPALLTLALRTIHRTGLCYGEAADGVERQRLAIGIFALASANSMDEKTTALAALETRSDLLDAAWRDGVERVAEREMAKEATVFSLQTLASRVGIHLGQRKAAGAIPILGAAVGGAVNAWYLHDTAQVARYVFQQRWLQARADESA